MPVIVLSHFWSFGDGVSSTEENPIHVYKMPGVYPWVHIVIDSLNRSGQVSGITYVYNWSYLGGINVSKTNRCLRNAVPQLPGQGVGWAIYDDINEEERTYNWPFPEGVVGPCKILDENEEWRQIVIDSNTFRHFEIGLEDSWVDGQGDYAGTEIESEILFREHPAPIGANAKIRHSESHLNIKPWFKDRRGAPGYTEDGFRENFEADLYVRTASSDDDTAITKQIPYRGQLIYDRHIESDFLQEGLKIRGAPWRLVSTEMWFQQIDTSASPSRKLMSEQSWADQFTEPTTWFPRTVVENSGDFLNYATGENDEGSRMGMTIGPDGLVDSASVGFIGASVTVRPGSLSGDFTIYVWLKSMTTGMVLYAQGTLTITLNLVGGVWQLVWADGTNNVTINLNQDFSGFVQFVITKEGDVLRVYENYILANTVLIDGSLTYTGVATIIAGAVTWSDFRLIPRNVTQSAIEYIYRDMTENHGNSTSPVF